MKKLFQSGWHFGALLTFVAFALFSDIIIREFWLLVRRGNNTPPP